MSVIDRKTKNYLQNVWVLALMQQPAKSFCGFCRNNGEPKETYLSHTTKDLNGIPSCPILRCHICDLCGETGDSAHTRSNCPLAKAGRAILQEDPIVSKLYNYRKLRGFRSSTGKIYPDIKNQMGGSKADKKQRTSFFQHKSSELDRKFKGGTTHSESLSFCPRYGHPNHRCNKPQMLQSKLNEDQITYSPSIDNISSNLYGIPIFPFNRQAGLQIHSKH